MNITEAIRNADLEGLANTLSTHPELVNQPLDRGFTPLVLATYLNQKAVAEILLKHGADVNAQDPMMGMTALMGVAFKGSKDLVALLLEHGADPAIRSKQGETALDFARKGGFTEIVTLLSQ